ncbi:putative receptor-like protein kinase At3g47110 [Hibiscus syriacus]|uniref:putative receptor-like protein kinase At3g47110 n=1 Tax=Hibiscus syriacus TaxID=106335 RepID=UPI0019233236|nr:putative receptor-like protein kinase At3g47110 [Hibiscus syriacus]
MGSELSTKGNVYSHDILLLEIFTEKRSTDERFKEGLSPQICCKSFSGRMIEIIDPILLQNSVRGGTIADITLNENSLRKDSLQCLNLIFEIALACSAESPREQTGMSDVVAKLCFSRDKLLRQTQFRHGIQISYAAQSSGYNVFLS